MHNKSSKISYLLYRLKHFFTTSITIILIATVSFSLILNNNIARAEIQATNLGSASFAGNDVDSKGILWVGDKNFTLYRSADNGLSFQAKYRLPGTFDATNSYSGIVWNVFIDSRDYIFASAGGTGALFRSTDGGASFTQVLKTNGTTNESFYISITEDNLGNLYTVTYTNGKAKAYMLKSIDGGANWAKIGNFGVIHFHAIKFNPNNHYLYAIMGEGSTSDAARIFRSKDGGATWNLVIKRDDSIGTVYLAIAFSENYVYLGQDYPNRICQIQRFLDDGSNNTFNVQSIYSPPPTEGFMPFLTATSLGDYLIFSNSAESVNGISRVITIKDGYTWTEVKSRAITYNTDNRWNFLTIHPRSGYIFGTIKTGESYRLFNYIPPPPTPTPTQTPTSTPIPTNTQTPTQQIQNNTPEPTTKVITTKPKQTTTPTPTPTLNLTPTSTPFSTPTQPEPTITNYSTQPQKTLLAIDQFSVSIVIVIVIMSGILITTTLLKRKNIINKPNFRNTQKKKRKDS